MRAPGGRALLQRPVRPVCVVVIDVPAENEPEMPFARDQHPVQALTPGAGDPPLGDRVRARRGGRRGRPGNRRARTPFPGSSHSFLSPGQTSSLSPGHPRASLGTGHALSIGLQSYQRITLKIRTLRT